MSGEPYRILIADDEETLRFVLRELLEREGCEVEEAVDGQAAVEKAREQAYDMYLLDLKMPRLDGLGALREIRTLYPEALAIVITAFGTTQAAIDALKAGAYDYFTKPFNLEELRIILMRALEKQNLLRRLYQLQSQIGTGRRLSDRIVGQCESMQKVQALVERVAEHDIDVLITGESGTGKERVAQAIHERSARSEGPLVRVNCAAIPEALLESELFGHERGAFTGATHARPGKFEAADGGTLMLDEIGEMPLGLQAKLLRVLQEREIERIGSNTPRKIDVRVLTATNRDLTAMVAEAAFREDLYFRINVMSVHLPPLRERAEDLPALVQMFVGDFNARFGKRVEGLSPEAMARIEAHPWPGNIRELQNTLQRAMVMASGPRIEAADLPANLCGGEPAASPKPPSPAPANGNGHHPPAEPEDDIIRPLAERVEAVVEREERRAIDAALRKMNGRRQETADLLGISRKSLHNKMKKYEMAEPGEA